MPREEQHLAIEGDGDAPYLGNLPGRSVKGKACQIVWFGGDRRGTTREPGVKWIREQRE